MKERPLLMSAPMVRAILEGRKTQTRRIVKLPHMNPLGIWESTMMGGEDGGRTITGETIPLQGCIFHTRTGDCLLCPHGQPGDRLWVRENGWERPERTPKMMREGADTWAPYYFDADGYNNDHDKEQFKAWGFKRRPSIHMPRWASRITLEITDIRIESLQSISEEDAKAEGICVSGTKFEPIRGQEREWREAMRRAYRDLWESLNGAGSWDANPFVWCISFMQAQS